MIDDDFERRMNNWALWYWGGKRSSRVSSIYKSGSRGRTPDVTPMPIINGEAIDTDNAVGRVAVDLRHVLRAKYLRLAPEGYEFRTASQIDIAAALFISYSTYLRRCHQARGAVIDELRAARHRLVVMQP